MGAPPAAAALEQLSEGGTVTHCFLSPPLRREVGRRRPLPDIKKEEGEDEKARSEVWRGKTPEGELLPWQQAMIHGGYVGFNTGNGEKISCRHAAGQALLCCDLVSLRFRC